MLLATDMLDLTTFLALTRKHTNETPVALYMHENQLTYPLPADKSTGPMRRQLGERDMHYVFLNYASMLAANLVLFNSDFHRQSWFGELPRFLKHFPDYNELGTIEELRKKSRVLPVGIDLQGLKTDPGKPSFQSKSSSLVPLILWNQRWEYDKNPDDFFHALYSMKDLGIPFRLALCGQQFGKRPATFDIALDTLSDHIIHVGHANEAEYKALLWEADITISTAHHEFFGISILEAIHCGAFPILPNRLSYPELISEAFHTYCLYRDKAGLVERLQWALTHPEEIAELATQLASDVKIYDWSYLAPRYDKVLAGA